MSLPEPARQRVLALADEALGGLAPADVPAGLRPFLRFTAAKRLRHAGSALAAAVETDEGFRQQVGDRLRSALPGLVEAVEAGTLPAAADPYDVAAAAYLLRATGWEDLVAQVSARVAPEEGGAQVAKLQTALDRTQEQLAAARAQAKSDTERLRAELASAKAEVVDLRHRLHAAREQARHARKEAEQLGAECRTTAQEATGAAGRAEAEARRLRDRVAELEAEREALRRKGREGRAVEDVRLRLLLDVVADAAAGLKRELALPTSDLRPADTVAARSASEGLAGVGPRAQAADDPAVLDALLALPRVHLVVDGYNVTKSGYGGLSLKDQRERLVTGLGSLVARTGAEVTCCFDGAAVDVPVVVAKPRGVRVLFSLPGELADDLIRRLVAEEPKGRPVVVVSSDKEVSAGITRSGARPVPAMALVRRLERG